MCPPAAAWQQGWATPGPLLLLGDELSFCSHSYLRSFPRRMMIDKRQLPPKLTSGESRERRGAKDPCYEMLANVSPDFIPLKYARRWLLWIMPGGAPQDMTECDDGTMVPSPAVTHATGGKTDGGHDPAYSHQPPTVLSPRLPNSPAAKSLIHHVWMWNLIKRTKHCAELTRSKAVRSGCSSYELPRCWEQLQMWVRAGARPCHRDTQAFEYENPANEDWIARCPCNPRTALSTECSTAQLPPSPHSPKLQIQTAKPTVQM